MLHSPEWPGTPLSPASTSQVLRLLAHTARMPVPVPRHSFHYTIGLTAHNSSSSPFLNYVLALPIGALLALHEQQVQESSHFLPEPGLLLT